MHTKLFYIFYKLNVLRFYMINFIINHLKCPISCRCVSEGNPVETKYSHKNTSTEMPLNFKILDRFDWLIVIIAFRIITSVNDCCNYLCQPTTDSHGAPFWRTTCWIRRNQTNAIRRLSFVFFLLCFSHEIIRFWMFKVVWYTTSDVHGYAQFTVSELNF